MKPAIKKVIISIVAIVIALAVAGTIYCVTTDQTPQQAIKSVFTSDDNLIIGKWESDANPGLSAYVFYDDMSYDSYISTVNFSGDYSIKGNKITLRNPETAKDIVYKFSVNEKQLTLTLIEQDGIEKKDEKENIYNRVDELQQKSLSDLIGQLAKDKESTTEE